MARFLKKWHNGLKVAILMLFQWYCIFSVQAQTNPTPHNLSASDYTFTGFSNGTTTTYPAGMQGWRHGSGDVTFNNRLNTASGDRDLDNNSTAANTNSIKNELSDGLSFLNSGSNGIGSIVVAVDASNRENLQVSFKAEDIRGGSTRQNALRLQYRIGTSGNFTDVISGGNSVEYVSDSDNTKAEESFSGISLPAATADESIVQIRWVYYFVTGSGARDRIRLDDIEITSTAQGANTPPIMGGLQLGTITSNQVALTGNITDDGGSSIIERGFVYSTSNNTPNVDDDSKEVVSGTATGSFQATVGSLSAGTKYYVRAYAENADGVAYSGATDFYTLSPQPTEAVDNFAAATGSHIRVGLSWDKPTDADACLILYKNSPITEEPENGVAYQFGDAIGDAIVGGVILDEDTTNLSLRLLTPSTQYHFKIFPFNRNGLEEVTYHYRTAGANEVTATTFAATVEDFENTNLTGSYGGRSFTNNGIEWTYTDARNEGNFGIRGKGMLFGSGNNGNIVSDTISDGVGNISFLYKRAFTNSNNRSLELFINGNSLGSTPNFGDASFADSILVFEVNNVNIDGDFVIEIKNNGAQAVIDEISWTAPLGPSIVHTLDSDPLPDETVDITATISGNDLITTGDDRPILWYRINEGSFQSVYFNDQNGDDFTFEIPGQTFSTQVDYYIVARDLSGIGSFPVGASGENPLGNQHPSQLLTYIVAGNKIWTGNGRTADWLDENNWEPIGVPRSNDSVLLNNEEVLGSYEVILPNRSIELAQLIIQPNTDNGWEISLILPDSNTQNPGISTALIQIDSNGVFKNQSGASAGTGLEVTENNGFVINNGGRYIHQTTRGHAGILNRMSNASGTERGIFEFDTPNSPTLSLTGRNFGILRFSSNLNPSTTYSATGGSVLTVVNAIEVGEGVTLNTNLSADLEIKGDVKVDGNWNTGTSGKLIFNGNRTQRITGTNPLLGSRDIEISSGSTVIAEQDIQIESGKTLEVKGELDLKDNEISGDGDVNIDEDAILKTSNPNGLAGAIAVTGTTNYNDNSFFIFNAGQAQSTNFPPGLTKVKGITIDNASDVTLNQAMEVTELLRFEQGKLIIGEYDVTLAANIQIQGSGPGRYIQINNSGRVRRQVGSARVSFPIGINPYTPIEMSNGGDVFYAIGVQDGLYENPESATSSMSGTYVDLTWTIENESSQMQQDVEVSFDWDAASESGTMADIRVGMWPEGSSDWIEVSSPQSYSGTSLGATVDLDEGLHFFGVGDNNTALPVELVSFEVAWLQKGKSVSLEWETASEVDNDYFLIERMEHGKDFYPIGKVEGSGNSIHLRSYHFIDEAIGGKKLVYYRLKQVDFDGSYAYSPIRVLRSEEEALVSSLKLFPNPATHTLNWSIEGNLADFEPKAYVLDARGKIIAEIDLLSDHQWAVAGLKSGIYFILTTYKGETKAYKWLKQ